MPIMMSFSWTDLARSHYDHISQHRIKYVSLKTDNVMGPSLASHDPTQEDSNQSVRYLKVGNTRTRLGLTRRVKSTFIVRNFEDFYRCGMSNGKAIIQS